MRQNSQQHRGKPSRKLVFGGQRLVLAGATLFVMVLAVGLAYVSSSPSPALAAPAHHTKKLRPILHNHSRPVCGKPAAGRASCAAYVSLASSGQPLTGTPALTGSLGPAQFHTAYNLPCKPGGAVQTACSTPGSYGPQTIAIVDAGSYNDSTGTLEESLQNYDTNYSLPACTAADGCLNIVNQSGATTPLPSDQGWSMEITLDVETAHMACQTCKVILVETNSNLLSDLAAGDATAVTFNPVVVSNSWYATSTDDTGLDSDFNHPGIAFIAAAGDVGSTNISWPADNPNVIGAAGTTLQLNGDNTWASETVWSGSGGSCSTHYAAPSWQTSLANWNTAGCGSFKAFGDISADADPNTGAIINMATSNSTSNWYDIGGTSLASPLIASMFALVGSVPSGVTASSIPYSSYTSANFRDITSGNNCVSGGQLNCTAGVGFDTPSGLGSPNGLGGFNQPPTQPTGLSATDVDQGAVNLSWTASTDNLGVTGYKIYRNGVQVGTTSSTTYNDSGLSVNTGYTYYVVAYDPVADTSTASSTAGSTTRYTADINQDGTVNLLDLSVLASKYGQSGGGLGRSDINQDGTVNLLDLSVLASQYGL